MTTPQPDDPILTAAEALEALRAKPPARDATAAQKGHAILALSKAAMTLVQLHITELETALNSGDAAKAAHMGNNLMMLAGAVVAQNLRALSALRASRVQVFRDLPQPVKLVTG